MSAEIAGTIATIWPQDWNRVRTSSSSILQTRRNLVLLCSRNRHLGPARMPRAAKQQVTFSEPTRASKVRKRAGRAARQGEAGGDLGRGAAGLPSRTAAAVAVAVAGLCCRTAKTAYSHPGQVVAEVSGCREGGTPTTRKRGFAKPISPRPEFGQVWSEVRGQRSEAGQLAGKLAGKLA